MKYLAMDPYTPWMVAVVARLKTGQAPITLGLVLGLRGTCILAEKKTCGVSFQVADVFMPVHKVVLAFQSPLFQEVLEDEFSLDAATPRIIWVKNVSLEAMEKFINFLYTGH